MATVACMHQQSPGLCFWPFTLSGQPLSIIFAFNLSTFCSFNFHIGSFSHFEFQKTILNTFRKTLLKCNFVCMVVYVFVYVEGFEDIETL